MDHTFYTDRLSAYFDQELKNEEHVIVDQHVEECQECQKILANLAKFDSFIEENSDLADNDYWEKSAQKIEKAISGGTKTEVVDIKKESSYKGLWWKLAGVAASIAVIAFISLYETDITDQLDNKYNAPAPPAEELEESKEHNEAQTEIKDIEEPSAIETEDSRSKISETPIKSIPETVPDNIVRTEEKPAASPLLKQQTKQEVHSQGASEPVDNLSSGRVNKDTEALSLSKEIPQKTAPQSVTPQKSKLVQKSREADEAAEKIEHELRDDISAQAEKSVLAVDSIGDDENLKLWQNTIVTQKNILADYETKKTSKKLTNGFAALDAKKDTTDKRAIYTELFEAYYNVALLSKDSLERKNALLQLNNYANDPKFIYQNTAKRYLDQFDSVQNSDSIIKRNKRK